MTKQLLAFTLLYIFSLSTFKAILLINVNTFIIIAISLLMILVLNLHICKPKIYLVDFACFKPPNDCLFSFSTFIELASKLGCFSQETISSMSKMLHMSGLGQETYLPPAFSYVPPKVNFEESINEVHMVLFSAMEDLLFKTQTCPQDIDILFVNCSGFCPSPSLSSIIINKFKLRDNIKSFNLSGMGCSASIAAIDMVKNLLTANKNSNAVVLSTEILTTGWYSGNDPSMLGLNCSFRMNGAAILLSNKPQFKHIGKYLLVHTLRTQAAYIDAAHYCAYRDEDSSGKTGVRVRQGLIQLVTDTIRPHITLLGLHILPLQEKLRYLLSLIKIMLMVNHKGIEGCQVYVPNFKTVIDHFILPASGRAWVKQVGKGLRLNERDVEPSLMTLYRFGNQSSSSMWYELAYIEAKERVKKGDKVWQLGFGTGIKYCSAVWECARPIVGEASNGPWSDCIDRYPVPEATMSA